jgi:hypothetical protein
LITSFKKSANEVRDTYEIVGGKCIFLSSTEDIKHLFSNICDITDEFEREFLQAITHFDDKKIGPYITEKYFHLLPSLKEALRHLKEDGIETRRCVIGFPPEHCFQTIQFLLRDNTVNVVCYMRSCDAIKNLPYDAWICSKLADIFSKYLTDLFGIRPYEQHKIRMMFGSLHVYKEDVKDVF